MLWIYTASTLLCLVRIAVPALGARLDDGSDLTFYVSVSQVQQYWPCKRATGGGYLVLTSSKRPDIRAPKLIVTTYDEAALTPGYIFTEPFRNVLQEGPLNIFSPYQIGPHIYDRNGDLVWSGAEMNKNRVVTDFRPLMLNGTFHMSFILQDLDLKAKEIHQPRGYILDSSYKPVRKLNMTTDFDIHEFLPLQSGESYLRVVRKVVPSNQVLPHETIQVVDTCATETNNSGHDIFSFCPSETILVEEVKSRKLDAAAVRGMIWDGFHMNSVEKYPNGDLMTSMRHTNAIYRASRATGEVVWRLGGAYSDFEQNFNFSGQHDARIVSTNDTVTIMSFFDNAAAELGLPPTASASSFKLVALYENEVPRRAELLKQFDRPDGRWTRARGNGQYLANGGAFVGWSDRGYASEFAPDGRLVQDLIFESERYPSYRIYKGDFVGTPNTLPTLKTLASASGGGQSSTVMYVSWNGATEVATWEFLSVGDSEDDFHTLGEVARTGFETSFVSTSAWRYTMARAWDREGNMLGMSAVSETFFPPTSPLDTQDDQSVLKTTVAGTFADYHQVSVIGIGTGAMISLFLILRYAGMVRRPLGRIFVRRRSDQHHYSLVSQPDMVEG